MPISLEQAVAYAEYIQNNPDSDFTTRFHEIRRAIYPGDTATFFATVPTGEDPETGSPRETIQRYRFDQEDIERIREYLPADEPAPRTRTQWGAVPTEILNVWSAEYWRRLTTNYPNTGYPWDNVTPQELEPGAEVPIPATSQTPQESTTLQRNWAALEEYVNEIRTRHNTTQPTPEEETRKETTMARHIPHPLAEFDQDTEFLFYNPMQTSTATLGNTVHDRVTDPGSILRAQIGVIPEDIPEPISRLEQCRQLYNPNYTVFPGIDIMVLNNNLQIRAGIPVERVVPIDLRRVESNNPYDIFTSSTCGVLCYWDDHGRMGRLHSPSDSGGTSAPAGWTVLLRSKGRSVHDYMLPGFLPIQTLQEAWDRCSESWKTWAQERSGRDPDTLLWETLQLYPTAFGLIEPWHFSELWGTSSVVDALYRHMAPLRRKQIQLTAPEYNTEDKTLTLFRQPKDLLTGRKTTMRVGKALKQIMDDMDDEDIKSTTSLIVGALTPPEFHIGFTKEDFDEAYTKGPSSCMTYRQERYWLLSGAYANNPTLRPTDAMVNGDIGVAVLKAGDRITARALIVESMKAWVRIYAADYATSTNGAEALKTALRNAGYEENRQSLSGQVLRKIPVPLDPCSDAADAYFHCNNIDNIVNNCPGTSGFTSAQRRTLKEKLDPRAFAIPYIDWENPMLYETDEGLVVSNDRENWHCAISSNLTNVRRGMDIPADRLGRSYYESGGMVTANLRAAKEWINECREMNATSAPTPEPEPVPAREPAPANWSTRLGNVCTDIELHRDMENYSPDDEQWPVYDSATGTITDYILTEGEVEGLSDELSSNFVLCDTPDDETVWIEDDATDLDIDGDRFITLRASEYDLVWCEYDEEWHNQDHCVRLASGEWCHEDDAVCIGDDWYLQDDEDIVYCERDDRHYLDEDCVYLGGGEYALADECYRLPNGDFIHRDDLESVT